MAKKEYIEREKVLALQTDLHFDNIEQLKYWKCRHIDPIEVQLLPAADVAPVVRGKWERKPDPFGFFDDIPVCSNCGNTTKWRETYLFCPYCGARMDGDADAD